MVLNSTKRTRVFVAGYYRGMKLFKPMDEQFTQPDNTSAPDVEEPFAPVQHTHRQSAGVKELVLK